MADERSDERATTSVDGATGGRPGGTDRVVSPDRDAAAPRVLVLVRAHCRTCDRMEGVVREIRWRVGEEHAVVDVDGPDADPEWRAEYGDRIPVTQVDGVEVGARRLEPDDLVRALAAGGTPR